MHARRKQGGLQHLRSGLPLNIRHADVGLEPIGVACHAPRTEQMSIRELQRTAVAQGYHCLGKTLTEGGLSYQERPSMPPQRLCEGFRGAGCGPSHEQGDRSFNQPPAWQ